MQDLDQEWPRKQLSCGGQTSASLWADLEIKTFSSPSTLTTTGPPQPLQQPWVHWLDWLTDCIILHKLSRRNGPANERGKRRSFSYWRFSYLVAYLIQSRWSKHIWYNIFREKPCCYHLQYKSSVLNLNRVSFMEICIKKSSILLSVDHSSPGWVNQILFLMLAGLASWLAGK